MRRVWRIGLVVVLVLGVCGAVFGPGWLRHRRRVAALRDPSPAVRAAAIRALARERASHLLVRMIEDEDADVRLLAVMRLGERGPKAVEWVRALVEALDDPQAGVRREAAWSLGAVGAASAPALQQALQDKRPRVRAGAARALLGACSWKDPDPWPVQQAKVIVPLLKRLLSDKDAEVRGNAAMALKVIARLQE
jgi:HEAT repeat protein